eukprot:7378571-Prymnesium_polylepis.1
MPKLEQLSCRGLVANLPPLRAKKALDGFAMGDAIVSPGGKKPGGGGGGETAEKLLRAAVVCCAVAWSEVLVQLDLKDVMNAPQVHGHRESHRAPHSHTSSHIVAHGHT